MVRTRGENSWSRGEAGWLVDGGWGLVVSVDVTANYTHPSPTIVVTMFLAHQRIELAKVIS